MRLRERQLQPHLRMARRAEAPGVHRAFQWLHLQEPRIRAWQCEVVGIAAPPFGERPRALWMAERMRSVGLQEVELDAEGNAFGFLRADDGTSPLVMLSAHLDTVFAADTPLVVRDVEDVLHAPGIADNGCGLAGLLALAAAFQAGDLLPETNVLFVANVGEEAEGNLRGMRHLFLASPLGSRIRYTVALEGAGNATVVTRGLGSRRYRVELTGPGGHAWTDTGMPNPIATLSAAIATLYAHPLPARPRTTLNVGEMHGGTSVTAVPQSATATFDLRSTAAEELAALDARLHRTVADAVERANSTAKTPLQVSVALTGNRPSGELPPGSRLLQSVLAVDRHLNLRTEERLGSTDANIPLSLGLQAIAVGAGGLAGGIHTTHEWYDARGRDLALRRVLLLLLDLCDGVE